MTSNVKVVVNGPDKLRMNTISSVSNAPFPVLDTQTHYEVAVAKRLQEAITLEGQAALALISAVPIIPETTGSSLNAKA